MASKDCMDLLEQQSNAHREERRAHVRTIQILWTISVAELTLIFGLSGIPLPSWLG